MTDRSRVRNFRYRGKNDQGNDRLRHSIYLINWLTTQANRLEVTVDAIVARLRAGETFENIEATAAPEPEPDPTP